MLVQTYQAPNLTSSLVSEGALKERNTGGLSYQTISENGSKQNNIASALVFKSDNNYQDLTKKHVRNDLYGNFDQPLDREQSDMLDASSTAAAAAASISMSLKVSETLKTTRVPTGLPIIKASYPETDYSDVAKTSSSPQITRKSCLDKPPVTQEEINKSCGHRVTFNSQNQVASQDRDGTLKVTYRQLGEKIKGPAIQVQCQEANGGMETDGGVQGNFGGLDYSLFDEWDNPFQPDGEVSQDAELFLHLWRDGQPVNEENIKKVMEEKENTTNQALMKERIEINSSQLNSSSEVNGLNNTSVVGANMKEMVNDSTKYVGEKEVVGNLKEFKNYPVALTYKQKHKFFWKKYCRVM